ncbi:MAG: ATP-binding protein, partial [Acidimicrobiaceae bacterium]|nr:ATP-binding protein [Acidimicrobiaceae bacterium]
RADVEPATALGDQGLLERLAGNLVENGLRHNVEGGWVTVSTAADSSWVTLEVANSGRLLNPDTVAGLVEPFRREGSDRTAAIGFGLGLSIVDAIVGAHGGTLRLSARPDGGLLVTARLPAAPQEAREGAERPPAPARV